VLEKSVFLLGFNPFLELHFEPHNQRFKRFGLRMLEHVRRHFHNKILNQNPFPLLDPEHAPSCPLQQHLLDAKMHLRAASLTGLGR
jgi:hypothetical protein